MLHKLSNLKQAGNRKNTTLSTKIHTGWLTFKNYRHKWSMKTLKCSQWYHDTTFVLTWPTTRKRSMSHKNQDWTSVLSVHHISLMVLVVSEEVEDTLRIDNEVRSGALSWRGLEPIRLAYNPCWPAQSYSSRFRSAKQRCLWLDSGTQWTVKYWGVRPFWHRKED